MEVFPLDKIRQDMTRIFLSNIEGKNSRNLTSTPHTPYFPGQEEIVLFENIRVINEEG